MKWSIIFSIFGAGVAALVVAPFISLWIRTVYGIPGPTLCLGCTEIEGWLSSNSIFIPGIIIIVIGIFFTIRKIKSS